MVEFSWRIGSVSKKSKARTGYITTPHGEILISNQQGNPHSMPSFQIMVDELLEIANSQETNELLHKISIIVPDYAGCD